MQRLEVSCAVRHIYIYIYVVSRLRVKECKRLGIYVIKKRKIHECFTRWTSVLKCEYFAMSVELYNSGNIPFDHLRNKIYPYYIRRFSSNRAVNTFLLLYKNQTINSL
jgi:hypothetical protein